MKKLIIMFLIGFIAIGTLMAAGQQAAQSSERRLTVAYPDSAVENVTFNDPLPVWVEVEKRLNLKINWEVLPGAQYGPAAQTRLAAGMNLPDVMQIPGSIADAIRYANQGLILKLNPLIDRYGPDIQQLFREQPELQAGIVAPDGSIYYVCNYLLDSPNGRGMIIRKDWIDRLNKPIPETTDQWLEILRLFKTTDLNGQGAGSIIPYTGNPRFFYSGFGLPVQQNDDFYHYYDEKTGRIQYYALQNEFRDYLTFANRLHSEGLLNPMFGTTQADQMTNDMLRRNSVGADANNPGDCDNYITFAQASGAADALYVWFFPPKANDGKVRWAPLHTARNGVRVGITKDANQPLAMEFLNYVWGNKDGVRLTTAGVEGVHWNFVNGRQTLVNDIINHPQFNVILRLRQIGGFHFIDLQTQEFNLARGVGQYKAGIELILASPDKRIAALPGFIPLDNEQSVINQYWADIQTYIDETVVKFIMGSEPLSNFDAFRQRLDTMGINRVAAEYQKMYDRYSASLRK